MSNWKIVEDKAGSTHNFEENKEIRGILFNVKNSVGPNNSTMYEIEVGEDIVSVWGASVLDQKMKQVEVGDEVKITYNGKKISDKTKRQYKDYTVQHRKVETTDQIDTSDLPF